MAEESKTQTIDPCSYANIHEVKCVHTHLNLSVDFEKKILFGNVDLSFKCVSKDKPISSIILDTRELDVKSVYLTTDANKTPLKHSYLPANEKVPTYGKPLNIALSTALNNDDTVQITIEYSTSPSAEAIQWLTPQQTVGKKLPYLFTQCQAIGARTLLPCQDSPGAKNTYSANISIHNNKELIPLMSALPDGDNKSENKDSITYRFKQPVPCCSYLIALVVGNLERREIDKRCAVYCEPGMIDAAQYEFANTGKMLDIAESICGEFVWGRYDLLMLPPSFPYGGMENPNLTFVTPTLIAGDRSLENVVAHEITHSWTGNLVTNVSWEHFWLNEGWTRFIEGKIMGKLNGEDQHILDIANSQSTLRQAVERLGAQHEFTKLNLSLKDTDPDDAFSSIPYEKGSEFLRYLEDLVGGQEVMAKFIKAYLANFRYKCLDSFEFKQFFTEYFQTVDGAKDKLGGIDWETWLKAPGMPPVLRKVESKMIIDAQDLVKKWSSVEETEFKANADDIKGWNVEQIEMFLDDLLKNYQDLLKENKLTKQGLRAKVNALKVYKFHESKNAEILFRFNLIALECDDEGQYDSVKSMLCSVGRMKFVRPTFRALIKNADRRKMAQQIYDENKSFYHPICAKMVAQDLAEKK